MRKVCSHKNVGIFALCLSMQYPGLKEKIRLLTSDFVKIKQAERYINANICLVLLSPSSRRAWIEIAHILRQGDAPFVALFTEGED